jgi:hypothetical protein
MPAFNNIHKISPPRHLPTTPYGKQSGNPNISLHLPSPLQTAQGTWDRTNIDNAQTFANHLASVFQPNPSNNSPEEEEPIISLLESPYQLKTFTPMLQTI